MNTWMSSVAMLWINGIRNRQKENMQGVDTYTAGVSGGRKLRELYVTLEM